MSKEEVVNDLSLTERRRLLGRIAATATILICFTDNKHPLTDIMRRALRHVHGDDVRIRTIIVSDKTRARRTLRSAAGDRCKYIYISIPSSSDLLDELKYAIAEVGIRRFGYVYEYSCNHRSKTERGTRVLVETSICGRVKDVFEDDEDVHATTNMAGNVIPTTAAKSR